MSDLYWLTDEQMARLQPYFPKSHGKPRVDDRRVLSGIVFVNHNGLRWCDAPKDYGPHKTLHNWWKRWGEKGIFLQMMEGLAAASADTKTVMIDATYLKAHRVASSLRIKRVSRPPDRPHQRRDEHQAARRQRCKRLPAQLLHDRGQFSDYTGAAALLDELPKAQWLLDRFRGLQRSRRMTASGSEADNGSLPLPAEPAPLVVE